MSKNNTLVLNYKFNNSVILSQLTSRDDARRYDGCIPIDKNMFTFYVQYE